MNTNTPARRRRRRGNSTSTARTPSTASPAPKPPIPKVRHDITGTVRLHPRGFGFVELDIPIVDATDPAVTHTSAFVPPPLARKTVTGDKVSGVIEEADGRTTVTTLDVTARTRRTVVGYVNGDGAVECDPRTVTRPVKGTRPDGQVGAVTLAAGTGTARAGTPIWAGDDTTTADRIWALVDGLDSAGSDIDPDLADAAAADLAAACADTPVAADRGRPAAPIGRDDRTNEFTFTIDGASSRDLDDAISVTAHGNAWRVSVHIADASRLIERGSPADKLAYLRGTTTYLAGWNWPMLDRAVSENAGSLLPAAERDTLTVDYTVSADGTVDDISVAATRICSDTRLTYTDVEAHLTGQTPKGQSAVTWKAVNAAAAAATALGQERDRRDTLAGLFSDPVHRVAVTDGHVRVADIVETPTATMLIERLMVAANESVGAWLVAAGMPTLFRSHPAPEVNDKLDAVAARAGATFPDADPLSVAAALTCIADADPAWAAAAGDAAAFAMNRATYHPDNNAHFGLASRPYLHFTSPLRRYADMVVHRCVHAVLANEPAPYTAEELCTIGAWLDARTGAAARAERIENNRLWRRALRTGSTFPARTVRCLPAGMQIRFDTVGLTAFVPANRLKNWEADDDGLAGRWGPNGQRRIVAGDHFDARIVDIDRFGALTAAAA